MVIVLLVYTVHRTSVGDLERCMDGKNCSGRVFSGAWTGRIVQGGSAAVHGREAVFGTRKSAMETPRKLAVLRRFWSCSSAPESFECERFKFFHDFSRALR